MTENNLNSLPPEAEPTPAAPEDHKEQPQDQEGAPPVVTLTRDEPPDPDKLKTEIEELAEKRRKAEEDAIYWRKQKAEARADYFRDRDRGGVQQPPPQEPLPGVAPEPKPSDFEDYDKYVIALTDHRVKVARAEWERDAQRRQEQQSAQERGQALQAKLQEGFQKYADFEEVAFDRTATHITPMIVDILSDCDHPADVAYYLAKNRVEGVAISRMTPIKAAREIAKLEVKLAGQANSPPPAPPVRKVTAAPPPINPVVGGSAGITKDPNKMSQKEFEQWRASQGARKF